MLRVVFYHQKKLIQLQILSQSNEGQQKTGFITVQEGRGVSLLGCLAVSADFGLEVGPGGDRTVQRLPFCDRPQQLAVLSIPVGHQRRSQGLKLSIHFLSVAVAQGVFEGNSGND